jgi:ABC-type amino acid transport substrate-binding protein
LQLVGKPVVLPEDKGYGMALRSNDLALQAQLNQALAAIKANGKYAQIVSLYFGKMDVPDCSSAADLPQNTRAMTKVKRFLAKLT